jgi:3-oxoacyl-[acyl-carrier-protein] synthase-3
MHQASTQALARAGVALSDVATVIAHQANLRIIDRTREALGVPAEKMFVNVDRCGNTGAASVAIALAEHLDATPPVPGSHLLLVAFGGGLTWAAAVVRAADIGAVMARRGFERFGAPRGRKGTILAPRAPVAPSYPNRVAG